MRGTWLVLLVLSLAPVVPTHADRDIVYAAHYYAPPGSHRTSHFHLYRINPDGTGKTQLTFDDADDDAPKWSPDGLWIAFTRQPASRNSVLCLLRANGGVVRTLTGLNCYDYCWSPDSRFLSVGNENDTQSTASSVLLVNPWARQVMRNFAGVSDLLWSPDGRYAYLEKAAGDEVLDLRTGKRHPVKDALKDPVWLGRNIVGFRVDEKSKTYFLRFLSVEGQETKQVKLSPLETVSVDPSLSFGDDTEDLLSVPSSPQMLTYRLYTHADKDWFFFRLNAANGVTHSLIEGNFLTWSPNGSRFCTTSPMKTVPYKKRRWAYPQTPGEPAEWRTMDEYRMVWAAPLLVQAAQGGPIRQLTPRLSWVTGADWRRTPKPLAQRMK